MDLHNLNDIGISSLVTTITPTDDVAIVVDFPADQLELTVSSTAGRYQARGQVNARGDASLVAAVASAGNRAVVIDSPANEFEAVFGSTYSCHQAAFAVVIGSGDFGDGASLAAAIALADDVLAK